MESIFRGFAAGLLSTTAILATPPAARAQDIAPQSEVETSGIGDIIVTARRRSENLQDVPIAVSAFDSATMQKTGATTALDIATLSPGVTMTEFNVGEPQTYIRGVGSQTDSAASEASVTVSMDEVPLGRGGVSPAAFLDMSRVEVLRGPQGTLYGKNASAGMLSFYSNRPDDSRFSAYVEASAGSFATFGGTAIVNAPLADGVALRAAGEYSTSDGYARNIRTGKDLQGGERYAGRLSLQAQSDRWTVLLTADYAKDDLDGDSRYITYGYYTPPFFQSLARQVDAAYKDVWESSGIDGTFQRRRNYGLAARAEYDADWATITSLTGYRNNRYSLRADYGGVLPGAFPFAVDDRVNESSHQVSQELRLGAPSGRTLQWVAGLFYYTDDIDRAERFVVASLPPLPAALGGDNSGIQDASSKSYAIFGQATLPFASIWELTLGARLTHDKKEVFQQAVHNGPPGQGLGFPFFPGTPYTVPAEASVTKPTWRASLSVEPAHGRRLYLSYDRGYKSGSFTSQAQNAAQATFFVKPEKLDSFNLGAKTQWLDNKLRVNIDAYYIDYKNLQVFEFGKSLNFVLANANATIKGVELQTLIAPSRNLTVGFNYAYMDGKFDTDPQYNGAVLPYKGNQLPRAPRNKVSAFVEATGQLFSGELLGRVSYDLQDSFFYNPSNDLASEQTSYGILGGYLSWESVDGLKFALTGKNLLNEKYSVHHISFQGLGFRIFAPPRSITLTVSKQF